MGTVEWGKDVADRYDVTSASMFDPAVVNPAIDLLAALAGSGRALEFAAGTGRLTLPLSERGIPVSAIELSPHMAEKLREKPGADRIELVVGDMARTRVGGTFQVVFLVWNSIMNLTTQDEQVEVFENAAAHLEPGGRLRPRSARTSNAETSSRREGPCVHDDGQPRRHRDLR